MKSYGYKGDSFNDRLTAASSAKQALLEKFRSRPSVNDPEMVARRAELAAVDAAREQRAAERKAAKEAETRRLAEEAAAHRLAEMEARKAEEAARAAERAAAAKAAREERYAARRARRLGLKQQ